MKKTLVTKQKQSKEDKSLTSQAVEGSFWGGFSTVLNRFGALVLSIILARMLLPENFGLYSFAMSIASIFMVFADLGINDTLIRYFSLYSKNREKSTAYFQFILRIKVFLSALVSLLLLLSAYPLSFWIFKKPELFMPLVMSSIFIFTSLIVLFFSPIFYAIKRTKYLGITEIIFQIIRVVIIAVVFIALTSTYYVFGIIAGLILTNIIIFFFLLYLTKKLAPFLFKKVKPDVDKKQILSFLGYITIASLSAVFFEYIDTVILGFFVSFEYIGYYRVAYTLIFGIASLFTYICYVLMPFFTILTGNRLETALNKSLKFMLMLLVPVTFGVLSLGQYFIKMLYGDAYLPSTLPFYFLSLLLLIYVPTALLEAIFFSKGKPKNVAVMMSFSLILNAILAYLFIVYLLKFSELWAITGAAAATVLSKFFLFIYISKSTRKNFKLSIHNSIYIKPILSGLIMFYVLKLINTFIITDMNLVLGIVDVLIGAIIYLVSLILLKGIVKEDIEVFRKIPIKDIIRLIKRPKIKKSL